MRRRYEPGTRVEREDGTTGTVLAVLSFGYKVGLDVDPDEWRASIIGPPSSITEVWEFWSCIRTATPEEAAEEAAG